MRKTWPILGLVILCIGTSACKKREKQQQPEARKIHIQEGYSETFIQALQQQEKSIEVSTLGMNLNQVQAVRLVLRTWPNKRVITVAFKGGSAELRKQVSLAVKPWSDVANITLDFGYDPNAANYREWSTSDTQYRADVRISFDSQPEPGYWSAIGKDSIKLSLRPPNIASMNFEGFADELPDDWRATTLHEFGHALGFAHEHQSPNSPCDQEYRWSDDPGYMRTQNIHHEFVPDNQGRKPGIYTVLGGAPNRWSPATIDFNLKQFAASTDWYLTSFDQSSIMKYVFQDWMYRDIVASTKSGCYGSPNLVLSAEDQKAAGAAYPRDPQLVKQLLYERMQVSHQILTRKHLSPQLRLEFKSIAADLEKSRRQMK
ncbi:MAG TPA: hypothetical protein VOA41_11655 [Candidatus Dormibacteraeota bacterium]|nr:hypothetical protein [Candidatus Dormibacteraeota bacterium]